MSNIQADLDDFLIQVPEAAAPRAVSDGSCMLLETGEHQI